MLFSPLIPDRDALFENIVLLLVYHAMCFPSSSFTMSLPPELPFRYPCNHHTIDCRDNFSVCQCRCKRQGNSGSSSHLGNVELIALTGSLFHAQTNGLSHIIEELLPKCEDDPKKGPTRVLFCYRENWR